MAKYSVTFKRSVVKGLHTIPNQDVQRILEKIDLISEDPRGSGCTKLSARELYRVRQDLYRIVYEIKDETLIINVIKIGYRSSVYKGN